MLPVAKEQLVGRLAGYEQPYLPGFCVYIWVVLKAIMLAGFFVSLRILLTHYAPTFCATSLAALAPVSIGSFVVVGLMMQKSFQEVKEANCLPVKLSLSIEEYSEYIGYIGTLSSAEVWELRDRCLHILAETLEVFLESHKEDFTNAFYAMEQLETTHQRIVRSHDSALLDKMLLISGSLKRQLGKLEMMIKTVSHFSMHEVLVVVVLCANFIVALTVSSNIHLSSEWVLLPTSIFLISFLVFIILDTREMFNYRRTCVMGSSRVALEPLFFVRERLLQFYKRRGERDLMEKSRMAEEVAKKDRYSTGMNVSNQYSDPQEFMKPEELRKPNQRSRNQVPLARESDDPPLDLNSLRDEGAVKQTVAPASSSKKQPLPPNWKKAIDKPSNRVYYYNRETRQTTWSRPQE